MTASQKCDVIHITSPDIRLHGVNMRETLKEVLDGHHKGFLRNIRDNSVELVYCSKKRIRNHKIYLIKLLESYLKSEKGKKRALMSLDKINSLDIRKIGTITINLPSKMKIEYSDELKEMMWALQAAGLVFQNTLQEIRSRDERKSQRRLKGLRMSLITIHGKLELSQHNPTIRFDLSILSSVLAEPPEETEPFIDKLSEIYFLLDMLNDPGVQLAPRVRRAYIIAIRISIERIIKFLTPEEGSEKTYKW